MSGIFLEEGGKFIIPATIINFVAREKFLVNNRYNAPVKISHIGEEFERLYLAKIEEPIAEQTLYYRTLAMDSADGSVIDELGGNKNVKTFLATMYSLMSRQRNAEGGDSLSITGSANVLYIVDIFGNVSTACVSVEDRGWSLDAYEFSDTDKWPQGCRIFSNQ